jgi:uncharacterized membrane protein
VLLLVLFIVTVEVESPPHPVKNARAVKSVKSSLMTKPLKLISIPTIVIFLTFVYIFYLD